MVQNVMSITIQELVYTVTMHKYTQINVFRLLEIYAFKKIFILNFFILLQSNIAVGVFIAML